MAHLTEPEKVFTDTVNTLETYFTSQEAALKNNGQPSWLVFYDHTDKSKDDLLKQLDRSDLNKKYAEMMADPTQRRSLDMVVLVLQNDFVGAVARDYYDVRRSRLTRLFHRAAAARGMTGGDGTMKGVVQGWVATKLKFGR